MATITEAIRAQFYIDSSGVKRGMQQAAGSVRVGTRDMSAQFRVLKGSILRVVTAMGGLVVAKQIASHFFSVNRESERLQASLRTVTGSAEEARKAFAGIEQFAKETPFQVEEVATAFIKLRALGLNPSEKSLRSYGNTASAMGKSLDQFIEAVADATTNEFERLKEFGIKARQQGDQVAFTFQGVTTTVEKNSQAISEYLTSIGEVNFAGAMEEQMNTLNGIISNIEDNVNNIIRTIGGEGGFNTALGDMLKVFRDWTGDLADNKVAIAGWTNAIVYSIKAGVEGFLFFGTVLKNVAEIINTLNPQMLAQRLGEAIWETGSITEGFQKVWSETSESVMTDLNDLNVAWENLDLRENVNKAAEAYNGLGQAAQRANRQAKATIDAVKPILEIPTIIESDIAPSMLELPTFIEASISPATEVRKNYNNIATEAERVAENTASMLASLIKGETSAAAIAKSLAKAAINIGSQFIPGGGILGSFLGGLFKSGSAGRIKHGPMPTAAQGMQIGNIGGQTKVIGVHANEGVATSKFMDSFERAFGRSAFMRANQTGQLPMGGITINIGSISGGNDTKREVISAIEDAFRKRRLSFS